MTPYSAAAAGSFSRRASSRSTALRASSGSLTSSRALAELLDLGLLGIALAELLLDRLQLLAQEVLALRGLHLGLDLVLDLRAELGDLELAVEDHEHGAQPLLDVVLLEQLLLLLGLQAGASTPRGGRGRSGPRRSPRPARAPRGGTGRARSAARRASARSASAPASPATPRRRRDLDEAADEVGLVLEPVERGGCGRCPGRGCAASRRGRGSSSGRPRPCPTS